MDVKTPPDDSIDSSDTHSNSSARFAAASIVSETSHDELQPSLPSSHDQDMKDRIVYVPDMFSSIMAVKPVVNVHYHEVKPKADSWISRCIFTPSSSPLSHK
jgi:hypothetical protein